MESIQQVLSGASTVGAGNNRSTATISRNGDLVGKMHLEVALNVAAARVAANLVLL